MNSLIQWLDSTAFDFLTLIVGVSLLLMSTAMVFCRLTKNQSAAFRSNIWQTAFLSLLFVPFILLSSPTVPLGWFSEAGNNLESSPKISKTSHDDVASVFPFRNHENEKVDGVNKNVLDPKKSVQPAFSTFLKSNANEQNKQTATIATQHKASQLTQSNPSSRPEAGQGGGVGFSWKSICVATWLLGAFYLGTRIALSFVFTGKISRESIAFAQSAINTKVPIFQSSELSVPVTVGLVRPRIIVPLEATNWPSQKLKLVLQHELAHVSRSDVAWQIVVSVVRSALWIQPLVWIGESMMKLERERACDDQVLCLGARPSDYATVLLTIAGQLSGRETRWANALSIAQKPIEKRLTTILHASVSRTPVQRRIQLATFLVFLLTATALTVLRPFEPVPARAESPVDEQDSEKVEGEDNLVLLPDQLVGYAEGPDGEKVAGCSIEVRLVEVSQQNEINKIPRSIRIESATSDAQGKFRLNTKGLRFKKGRFYIRGFARSKEFPSFEFSHGIQEKDGSYQLPVVKFREGRKIRGQLVSANGDPLVEPTLRITGDYLGKYVAYWSSGVIHCDADGKFSTVVPAVGRVEMRATAGNCAGKVVAINAHAEDLGTIELSRGTSVSGQVLDRNRTPVPGVVVRIENCSSSDVNAAVNNAIFYELSSSVRTDAQGRFRLPPHMGLCSISVGISGLRRTEEAFFYADQVPPIVCPKEIDLTNLPDQLSLNLIEAETVKVSGTVRWPDGRPAQRVHAQVGVASGNSYPSVEMTFTDTNGRYEVNVPLEARSSVVSVFGTRDAKGVWYFGVPQSAIDAGTKNRQSESFGPLTDDVSGVDWVLKTYEKPSAEQAVRPRSEADMAFSEIEVRHSRANIPFPGANPFIGEFLELEEKFRGEHAAVVGLNYVLKRGGNSRYESENARSIALSRLEAHYLLHESIDVCTSDLLPNWFESLEPDSMRLVRRIQKENPSPHSRALAVYTELHWISDVLLARSYGEQRNWDFPNRFPENPVDAELIEQKRAFEARFEALRRVDVDDLKVRARKLSRQLLTEYADIKKTGFISYINGIGLEKHYADDRPTFAEVGKRIVFELERIQVGQVVPEIEGKDPNGNTVRLSDLRGKVVVLVFVATDWGNAATISGRLKALKEKYPAKSFEAFTVLMNREIKTAQNSIDDETITWPSVFDGERGPISTKWRCRSSPSDLFVIDPDGVITRRMTIDHDLEKVVDRLIKKSNQTP